MGGSSLTRLDREHGPRNEPSAGVRAASGPTEVGRRGGRRLQTDGEARVRERGCGVVGRREEEPPKTAIIIVALRSSSHLPKTLHPATTNRRPPCSSGDHFRRSPFPSFVGTSLPPPQRFPLQITTSTNSCHRRSTTSLVTRGRTRSTTR